MARSYSVSRIGPTLGLTPQVQSCGHASSTRRLFVVDGDTGIVLGAEGLLAASDSDGGAISATGI
jgi:hypothetical protein